MTSEKGFCTDCNENRPIYNGRCVMCGGARIIEAISHTKMQVGNVGVTFTVGRIPPKRHLSQE